MTKPILLLLLSILLHFNVNAQTSMTPISGIINDFAAVQAIDLCDNRLTVSSTTGFETGMAVVLMQMKGATIKEGNNNNFGEIEAFNGVGIYETNAVANINGNSIFLTYNILNEYDVENGNLQLVSMPVYESAEVDNILTTTPWDGSKGGVIAIKVENELILNADIDATGMGFRGGKMEVIDNNNDCTGGFNNADNFFYELNNWRGAQKGEGVAAFVSGKEAGKGPQANGGGGGNDHNAGGGGGANASEGGDGGERDLPFFTTSCKGGHPGLKGIALPNDLPERVFFGGGGGAGHTNNSAGSDGGNGGGIVIIQAQSIIANGNRLIAEGASALDTEARDGAGGGGAGGTIVVEAETISGNLIIELSGGNGGSVDNDNTEDCFGPGGGGGGGRLITNLNMNQLTINNSGGLPGQTLNSTRSCDGSNNGAQNGRMGQELSFSGIAGGTELGGAIAILEQSSTYIGCYDAPLVLNITAQGLNAQYQWQVNQNGMGFQNIDDNEVYEGTQTPNLTINDVTDDMLNNIYLLVISSDCAADNVVSEFISIDLMAAPEADFSFTTNDREVNFTNLSQHGMSYFWDFGDGNTSTDVQPGHTYQEDGEYEVSLKVVNPCDSVTLTQTVYIGTLPVAGFSTSEPQGCAPLNVQFTNLSSSNATGFLWFFEGGTPATSTAEHPVVSFEAGGSYNVQLIAANETGADTVQWIDYINVNAGPLTSFFVTVNELEVEFNNTTVDADSYIWNFGDGTGTSTEPNPVYSYLLEDEYIATLTATNECGSRTIELNFTTGNLPNADFTVANGVGCTPLTVEFENLSSGTNIGNWEWTFEGGNPATSSEQNPTVEYNTPGVYPVALKASNNLGESNRTRTAFITVYADPTAAFEYEIMDGTVIFTNLTTDATDYGWNFGDGSFSTEENPSHTYTSGGVYSVTLNATNPACGSTVSEIIQISISSTSAPVFEPSVKLYPNPTTNELNIELEDASFMNVRMEMFSVNGQKVEIPVFLSLIHI